MQPDSTLPAMVAFIKRRLVKTAEMGGQRFPALAETAERFNETSWFWTDDNAKAAELLAEPGLYDADPTHADAALDFVLRMSEGAVIQRRCGPPELRVLSADPRAFRVETAFFILEGDLSRGLVRHALRFNDGRTVTAAQHTGNSVSVRQGRRDRTLDVEEAITDFGVETGAVETGADQVAVWHSSRVAFPATVAAHILFARAGRYAQPPPEMRLAALQAWPELDGHREQLPRPGASRCWQCLRQPGGHDGFDQQLHVHRAPSQFFAPRRRHPAERERLRDAHRAVPVLHHAMNILAALDDPALFGPPHQIRILGVPGRRQHFQPVRQARA